MSFDDVLRSRELRRLKDIVRPRDMREARSLPSGTEILVQDEDGNFAVVRFHEQCERCHSGAWFAVAKGADVFYAQDGDQVQVAPKRWWPLPKDDG